MRTLLADKLVFILGEIALHLMVTKMNSSEHLRCLADSAKFVSKSDSRLERIHLNIILDRTVVVNHVL